MEVHHCRPFAYNLLHPQQHTILLMQWERGRFPLSFIGLQLYAPHHVCSLSLPRYSKPITGAMLI